MQKILAIRREDLEFERRTPLCPTQVTALQKQGINIVVQPSKQRVFVEKEYEDVGAQIEEDITKYNIVLGLKEISVANISANTTYLFFSHTIKGQKQNMLMLQQLLDLNCTLIDYERIVDGNGRRLIFFGPFAGLAGMIDSLWAFGQRLLAEGKKTPLSKIRTAKEYDSLAQAKKELSTIGNTIVKNPTKIGENPLVFGITGYGNVSQGAQEILRLLQVQTITPKDLLSSPPKNPGIYMVIFREEHMAAPRSKKKVFELQDYYQNPDEYCPIFDQYLPLLDMLVNCVYWDEKFPRLVTIDALRNLYSAQEHKLQVIGDISCDIKGSIQATVQATSSKNPVYVYDPFTGKTKDGVVGNGPVILAISNLPSELPKEASETFGSALLPFLPGLLSSNLENPLEKTQLSDPLKRATIVYHGELTKDYEYMKRYL